MEPGYPYYSGLRIKRALRKKTSQTRVRHRRSENSPSTTQNFPANVRYPTTIFYSDMEPLSKYSPVTLHLSPASRVLSENPDRRMVIDITIKADNFTKKY